LKIYYDFLKQKRSKQRGLTEPVGL